MPKVTVNLGNEVFSFTSKQQWANKAHSWFKNSGLRPGEYIAIDAWGRVCTKGAEFMRAEEDDTYPVTVYRLLV